MESKMQKQMNLNYRFILYDVKDISDIQDMLQSEFMVKLLGILIHFAYWLVFGTNSTVQIDGIQKKQMFVAIYELSEKLQHSLTDKLWYSLGMSMVILYSKMIIEYIFKNTYLLIFDENDQQSSSPGQVAMDKIYFLIERIFDPNNLYSRLTFLESDFKQKKNGAANDRKFMQKRLFGVSPYMDIVMNKP